MGLGKAVQLLVTPLTFVFTIDGLILVVRPMTRVLCRPRAYILGSTNPFDKYDFMETKNLFIASKQPSEEIAIIVTEILCKLCL